MRKHKTNTWIAWMAAGYFTATIAGGCGGGTSAPPPALSISFSGGNSQTVAQGQSVTISAVITNDPSAKGVTWKLSGPGALSKQTTTSVEYDAPATVASSVSAIVTATAVADPTKSATDTVTITLPISITVSPENASVAVSAGQPFTASIQNDLANKGVTWNLTQSGTPCSPGCGSVAPTISTNDVSVTYTAPTAVPTNANVRLTATSMADPTRSASATLTIILPAISVSISPSSVLLGANVAQEFIATVQNDPATKGVTWTLGQDGTVCSAGCGTLSALSSPSGTPITYTAPASVPTDPTVSVIATSAADTATAVGSQITITLGNVKLVPASLKFGTVLLGQSTLPQTATLTNTGKSTLTITSITIPEGPHSGDWTQTNTCVPSVGAGQSCAITVIFKPQETGFRDTTVSISDDSPDSPQQLLLTGKGRKATNAAVRSALVTETTVSVPHPTGPNTVGTREIDMVDFTRNNPFVSDGTKRELLVRFWYPASLSEPCQPAQYTSAKTWSYFSQIAKVRLPDVKTNSCLSAPVTDGRHPVVVFTPGFTATFTDYSFLFEDLASRGYVVASVNHTYEATAVEFPDGRFVESTFGSHLVDALRGDEQALTLAVSVRLEDLKFVVDELDRLNAGADRLFAGKLDMSHVALAGHSLGGLTAILGLAAVPRFEAAVVIDGVLQDGLKNDIQTPVLMLTAGSQDWSANLCRLGSHLRGPQYVVNFQGAEHVTPSDAVWLAKGAIKTGNMGPEKTIAALRQYIAAFLDANVRGEPPGPRMIGLSSDYPDAHVTTRAQFACSNP